jgi:Uma2 family endonuclease
MATELVSATAAQPGRLFTAADLAAMPTHLPSGDVDYELDHGRLVIMVPPGQLHGSTQSRLDFELQAQGEKKGHGRAFTEVGIVLSRRPDTVLGADNAFVCGAKLPIRESPEGYLETIPDLVVEIRSRNDTAPELDAKVAKYLAAGVRVVWLADPVVKTIAEHRPGTGARIYQQSDTLALDDVIPGFRLKLAEIFAN